MSKIYEIDPEADTLIVVRPLAESFAPWPENDSSAPKTNGTAAAKKQVNGVLASSTADVRIKVSSKHLSLASPRFRDLLAQAGSSSTNGVNGVNGLNGVNGKAANSSPSPANEFASSLWRSSPSSNSSSKEETKAVAQSDGRTHVLLEGLDADAAIAVLNIVHGRGGKGRVPKTLTLEQLARIAVVVDRFKLQDAVEIYAERWLEALHRRGVPTTYTMPSSRRDLVLWIYVAYVFERNDIFKEATRIAATQSAGPLPALPNLPLRPKIAADIDQQRQAVIAQALDVLEETVDKLVNEDRDKDTDAKDDGVTNSDTFLLGSLIRTLHRDGLYWPRPEAPYAGVSVAGISRAAHSVQTQVWKLAFRVGDTTRSNRTNNQLLLTPKLDSLRASVAGLELKSDLGYNLY